VIIVIGHYPDYVQIASARGLSFFQIEAGTWNSMSAEAQWAANQDFLDNAIAEGAVFLLATPPAAARAGSWYHRELDYLRVRGYQARLNGLDWELFR
jgi:hypothetical protein